jgi:murein DD-endopeptidase MepM/ murein hydrolase activator NlpD
MAPMKHLMKPVGQCLTTAVMASALFDLYMLHPVDASPVESGETPPTANQAASADPAPAPVEAIAPPEIISPMATPVAEAPVAEAVTTTTPEPLVEQPALTTPAPEVPVAPSENVEASRAAPLEAPTADKTTPAQTSSPVAEEARIEAVRQQLADEMQAMLERDRPQREAQLKQNLVAAAFHYAQAGQVEQARQTAQHPVFSAEEQAELLAQIDKLLIADLKQPPVIEGLATTQPPTVASPGSVVMLPSAWSTGRLSIVRPNWTAACPVAPVAATTVKTVATVPPQSTTAQPSIPQAAVQPLPTSVVALDVASIAKQANPAPAGQFTTQDTVALPKVVDWQLDPDLKTVDKQPNLDQVAVDLELGQMVSSALTGMLDKVGVKPSVVLPSSVTSALGLWFEPTIYQAEDWVANGQTQTNPNASLNLSADVQLAAAELTQTPLFQDVENSLFAGLSKSSQMAGTAASKLKSEQPQTVMVSMTQSALATMGCGSIPTANFSLGDAVRSVLPQQLRNVGMVFPLPIPAALTSAFGWRIHPISGDRRFHAGIDLGAPTGTPVLAAVSGRVVAADYMGGYGLAIVIENGSAPQRNLYAHLSGIAVRPGMQIEQGSVIGWVGSTGNSTGPHLHFETQALTTSGWTAVNPLAASFATASAAQ